MKKESTRREYLDNIAKVTKKDEYTSMRVAYKLLIIT